MPVGPPIPRLLVLEGAGRPRGEAYGEGARDLIAETADRLLTTLGRDVRIPVSEYLELLTETTGFRDTARQLVPDVLDEVDGVAAASGVDLRTVLALNLLDEEWWFRSRFARISARSDACSSFGVRPPASAETIIGQNMDLPDLQGVQVVLDIRPEAGPRLLAPSYAGMINTNAMNEHGLGICVNTLPQLASSTTGLPVAFVIRALANQPNLEAAVRRVRTVPHASGQNYLLGTESGVRCFECGADSMNEYAPGARIAHTNHPLVWSGEATSSPDGAAISMITQPAEVSANSVERLTSLQDRIAFHDSFGATVAKEELSSTPMLRGGQADPQGSTFYGVIMLPARRTMLVTDGPPVEGAFREYRFC